MKKPLILLLLPLVWIAGYGPLAPAHGQTTATEPSSILVKEARPCAEIVAGLAKQWGEALEVDPALAEQKLTISLRSLTPAEVKRHLAEVALAQWITVDRNGKKRQLLRPTKARLQQLQNARQAVADQKKQMKEQLLASANWHASRASAADPNHFSPVFPPAAYALLKELPPDFLAQTAEAANPHLRGSEGDKVPGAVVLGGQLGAAGQAALRHLLDQFADYMETKFKSNSRLLRERFANIEEIGVEGWANAGSIKNVSQVELSLTLKGRRILDLTIASGRNIPPGVRPEEIKIEPKPDENSPVEKTTVQLEAGKYRYDRALTLLANELRCNLIADYYTSSTSITLPPQKLEVGAFLAEFDRNFGCVHYWRGNTLFIRTANWAEASLGEPVAAVTDRLEASSGEKGPEFSALLDAARRSNDEQLATLEYHTDPLAKRLPLDMVPRLRMNAAWLRAYAALPELPKRAASGANGLQLGALAPAVRAAWQLALMKRGSPVAGDGPVWLRVDGSTAAFKEWPNVPQVMLTAPNGSEPYPLWRDARSY